MPPLRLSQPERFAGPARPRGGALRVPAGGLALVAALALSAALASERGCAPGRSHAPVPPRIERAAADAEELWRHAAERIGTAKAAAGALSGASPMIGAELSPLVTTLGSLEAKLASSRKGWARVLTLRLAERGVGAGSFVAAGFSGSFPALNLAFTAACQALGADLAAVSSVTASTWGANQPGFTWPEMEALLVEEGLLRRASVAVSAGGRADCALDLEPEDRETAARIREDAARRLGCVPLNPGTLEEAVRLRMEIYDRFAHGRRTALYANIGGTEASMGASSAVLRLRSGFLPDAPFDFSRDRGVMAMFAGRGVQVLSLLNIEDLARRWDVR